MAHSAFIGVLTTRWRSTGCGPTYLKIQGLVRYRAVDVLAFEEQALRVSTEPPLRQTAQDGAVAEATSLPMYMLTHPKVRETLGLPFIRVGKLIRFNIDEVMAWARRTSAEMQAHGVEDTSDPTEDRRSLLQAIGNLAA